MDTFRTEQFWFSLLRGDSPRELWRPELEVIFLLQGTGRIYSPGLNAACAMLFRFRTRKNIGLNVLSAVGSGALFALLALMGGFMTYNYLSDNLGDISKLWMVLPALLMAAAGIWIARCVPAESRSKALRYAAVALLYFILVILIMNSLKTVRTVGCPEFVEKGYRSQLRSVTLLKNRNSALPLREGIKAYVPDRFIKSHLDFMSHPIPDSTAAPAGKGALAARFTLVDTPEGLLPVQIPANMDTVERQREDVAFDVECCRDSEGHTYDFGFGMNYDGVIQDERIRRYKKGE